MNLDQDFFQVSKLSEDQKKVVIKNGTFFSPISGEDQKKVFTRNGTLFSPNSSTDLRSDAHQSQIIGGDADKDHTQIVGGICPLHPPRVLAALIVRIEFGLENKFSLLFFSSCPSFDFLRLPFNGFGKKYT